VVLPRRFLVLTALIAILLFVAFISSFKPGPQPPPRKIPSSNGHFNEPGTAIAPKLGNETLKYVTAGSLLVLESG
jgi:hypothetical protein